MRLLGRFVPVPLLATGFMALCLFVALFAARPAGTGPADPDAAASGASTSGSDVRASKHPAPPPPPPPAPAGSSWSGHAFDACRAPSQRVMDRWRTSSPFTGVGIYLGGIHRACEQRHLTSGWVRRQIRSGWKLLPIWVGPQASCTGYDHRIVGRPGPEGRYAAARRGGVRQARLAVAAARNLRLPRGEVLFYDIEPYDLDHTRCRRSSLAFLEEWTKELHRRGYRSGVYSHVNSAIALMSRTGRSYVRPDAVWYAWIDRVGTMPREYVADPDFMRKSRVHQYVLDTRVEFGGIRMDIDWNFVSLGAARPAYAPATCDQLAGRVRPRQLAPGARGLEVRALQCLVLPGQRHPIKTTGRYDRTTLRAVRTFQQRRGLRATGAVDRRTWTALLANGATPMLRKGARGEHVRRLQRTLNVAIGRAEVKVDGAYGPSTARAVRNYRQQLGLGTKGVVTPGVWKALARGKVLPGLVPPAKAKATPKARAKPSPKVRAKGKARARRH